MKLKVHHKKRLIGMRPAQVDNDEERKIASQKASETVEIQDYYDNKYLNREHPQAHVLIEIQEGK